MSKPIEKVLEQLPHLSASDRAIVRAELEIEDEATGTPEEVEAAWLEEIERRVKSIEDGTAEWVDGDAMLARLRAKYRPR